MLGRRRRQLRDWLQEEMLVAGQHQGRQVYIIGFLEEFQGNKFVADFLAFDDDEDKEDYCDSNDSLSSDRMICVAYIWG